jgi:hypothetical protein
MLQQVFTTVFWPPIAKTLLIYECSHLSSPIMRPPLPKYGLSSAPLKSQSRVRFRHQWSYCSLSRLPPPWSSSGARTRTKTSATVETATGASQATSRIALSSPRTFGIQSERFSFCSSIHTRTFLDCKWKIRGALNVLGHDPFIFMAETPFFFGF